ncbi:MAG TPA: site-specific integrase [Gammaproteobacteria bacterium]|jgi:integrase|nr:site-specific integrase [Gammaproteobacteria bacterium]
MANIEKRVSPDGKTTFRVKVRLKGFPVQSASFERLTDARKWAQQTETSIREGRHFKTTEAKRHTLAEAITRYIKYVLPTKPKSAYTQVGQLEWWKENIGTHSLADVTPALISQHRDKLAQGKTPRNKYRTSATVNRYLAALSHVFTIATKEWMWVEENPLRKVSKMKEPRGRVRFLSDKERERLLTACKESESTYLYTIVVLALSTGARRMELLSLDWQDVDLIRGVIILHETKNGERRVLHLVGHALALLKEHAKIRQLNCDLVFPGKNLKNPIDIRTPWETALKRAEITDYKFHDNRHSAASYLAMNGASLAEIAEILGHKTLQMVKRYAHLSDAHTSKVVARMNEKIFGIS